MIMKSAFSRERDATFGQMMLTLRTALDLTQAELAGLLGVSRRAIGGWEAGNSAPNAEHLKHFIELAVRKQVFPAGQEAEEIRVLWKKAHQKVLLDEEWLQALLAPMSQREALPVPSSGGEVSVDEPALASAPPATARPAGGPRVDWEMR